jgi:hypothetical protein
VGYVTQLIYPTRYPFRHRIRLRNVASAPGQGSQLKERIMQTNVGTTDRIIRAIAGIAALLGALVLGIGTVGGILALTAAVGTCGPA